MGKIDFIFLLLMGMLIDSAYGQNTFPPTGNVGIGVSPSIYPLHVKSTAETSRTKFEFGTAMIDLVTYSTGNFAYSNSSGM